MPRASRARRRLSSTLCTGVCIALVLLSPVHAEHHMKRAPVQYVPRQDDGRGLVITNQCAEDIWPGIGTQAGEGPDSSGFLLSAGETKALSVSANWQGRVWGRTNCTFNRDGSGPGESGGVNGYGQACGTGDCAGVLDCKITVSTQLLLFFHARAEKPNHRA